MILFDNGIALWADTGRPVKKTVDAMIKRGKVTHGNAVSINKVKPCETLPRSHIKVLCDHYKIDFNHCLTLLTQAYDDHFYVDELAKLAGCSTDSLRVTYHKIQRANRNYPTFITFDQVHEATGIEMLALAQKFEGMRRTQSGQIYMVDAAHKLGMLPKELWDLYNSKKTV